MKKFIIFASVLLAGLLIGLVIGLSITVPRKVGISEVTVSKQVIDGQDVLIVDSPEHPPWAQQHLLRNWRRKLLTHNRSTDRCFFRHCNAFKAVSSLTPKRNWLGV